MSAVIEAADLYCGCGGASTGLHRAAKKQGRNVNLVAVNHWNRAIETHSKNYPDATHLLTDVEKVNPREAVPGGKLDLLMAGPSCVHHSIARGGRPTSDQQRSSAGDIVRWTKELDVKHLLIENVPEFLTWGPVDPTTQRPCKQNKGANFRLWVRLLENQGYRVEWRVLNSAHFGDATTRKRLFVQASKSGRIRWPKPTHYSPSELSSFPDARPWKPAREIIDWSLPSQSIFNRKKPLAANTLRRIFAGLEKFCGIPFVLGQQSCAAPRSVADPIPTVSTAGAISLVEPFIVVLRKSGDGQMRPISINEPLPTICAGANHFALCEPFAEPFLMQMANASEGHERRCYPLDRPLPTITTKNSLALIEPFLVPNSSSMGPRDLDLPLPTITTNSRGVGLCQPYLVGIGGPSGAAEPKSVEEPLGTLLAQNHRGVVEPYLVRFNGGTKEAHRRVESIGAPLSTLDTSNRLGLCEPFLVSYYGNGQAHSIDEPLPTVTTRDHFAVVTVEVAEQLLAEGYPVFKLDIKFRMLQDSELKRAHSFEDDYVLAGSKQDRVKQVGNSWTVGEAEALCSAILEEFAA